MAASEKLDSKVENNEEKRTLRLIGIGKSFPGVRALDNVSLKIASGQVVALVGENGAGKSTLVKILAGVHSPDDGRLEIDGQTSELPTPQEARAVGISIIHQHLSLVPNLSVTENMFLGRELRLGRTGLMRRRMMRREVGRLLEELNLKVDPDAQVADLTVGQRQMVEVAKAMLGEAWLIVMDEPTSALSNRERDQLYELVGRLVERGVGILYISHKMDEIYHVASQAIVLRDGQQVGEADLNETDESTLIEMMVGRQVDDIFPHTEAEVGDVVLSVENLSDGELLKDATFSIRSGEMVVLSGLMGSGRSEALQCVFGLSEIKAGKLVLFGEEIKSHTPKSMSSRSVAYIPEDRHEAGIFPAMAAKHNISSIWMRSHNRVGVIDTQQEGQLAQRIIEQLNVRPPNAESLVRSFSGGNQQKVVLGRWFATDPKVLLLDEPTRGVDVGAKPEIHQLVGDLKARGVAIVMVSSELPEVLGVADRIVVMHEGRTVAELERGATEQEIMKYAVTGTKDVSDSDAVDDEPKHSSGEAENKEEMTSGE